jgi:hypothetical protein
MTDTTEGPSRPLGWRARSSWRRTARRIVAEHVDQLLSRLGGFRGLPICGLATSAAGTVRITVPGWAITVTEVAARAQAALTAAVERHHCCLAEAGRYGRFWWVAVEYNQGGDRRRTLILGSRLVVTRIEDGHAQLEAPGVSPLLTAS